MSDEEKGAEQESGVEGAEAKGAEPESEVGMLGAPTRPGFAKDWPRDAELDRLLAAFDAGDYALVKRDAPSLAERATDDLVRRAAEQLLDRTRPDPLSSLLILVAAALLTFFAYWFYTHGH